MPAARSAACGQNTGWQTGMDRGTVSMSNLDVGIRMFTVTFSLLLRMKLSMIQEEVKPEGR